MTKILSCDLSLTGSAFALLFFDCGELKEVKEVVFVDNKKNTKLGHGARLHNIAKELEELLADNPDIDHVVREKGFSRHAQTTQTLFKVVGVSDLMCHLYKHDTVHEIAPTTVKKSLTGDGKASKEQVEEAVRLYLPPHQKTLEFQTDDCSDAVAVGIAFALEKKFLKKLS